MLHTAITAKSTAQCLPVSLGEVSSVDVAWHQLMEHRDYLVRFARRKLHDPSLAEDAVHDVFEAVLSGRATFGGRAALRSWLTAILKNKIIDTIRQRARFDSLEAARVMKTTASRRCRQPATTPAPKRSPPTASCSPTRWAASPSCRRVCAT